VKNIICNHCYRFYLVLQKQHLQSSPCQTEGACEWIAFWLSFVCSLSNTWRFLNICVCCFFKKIESPEQVQAPFKCVESRSFWGPLAPLSPGPTEGPAAPWPPALSSGFSKYPTLTPANALLKLWLQFLKFGYTKFHLAKMLATEIFGQEEPCLDCIWVIWGQQLGTRSNNRKTLCRL
jgi:hypothetical protein